MQLLKSLCTTEIISPENAVLSNAAHDLQVSHFRVERPSIPPSPTVDLAVYIHNRGTTIRFAAES